jgi:hypothetical protein
MPQSSAPAKPGKSRQKVTCKGPSPVLSKPASARLSDSFRFGESGFIVKIAAGFPRLDSFSEAIAFGVRQPDSRASLMIEPELYLWRRSEIPRCCRIGESLRRPGRRHRGRHEFGDSQCGPLELFFMSCVASSFLFVNLSFRIHHASITNLCWSLDPDRFAWPVSFRFEFRA